MTSSHSAVASGSPDRDSTPANESSPDADVGLSPNRDVEQQPSHDAAERDIDLQKFTGQTVQTAQSPATPCAAPASEAAPAPAPAPASASAAATATLAATVASTPSHHTATAHLRSSTLLEPEPSHEVLVAAFRKTSPGLAARLKALGLEAAAKRAAIEKQHVDSIGRLDEQQLRQLDEKHQAGSVTAVIPRRGRPWKGIGAPPPHSRSLSQSDDVSMSPIADSYQLPEMPDIQEPEFLEDALAKSLAMDTQKYRLPDHLNGNGTKVTLDTRREHLERITRPPSPKEYPPLPSSPPAASPSHSHSPSISLSYSPAYSPSPPTPPPKESPLVETAPPEILTFNDFTPDMNSYFTPSHNRPGSIYTLSRVSFANQLAQLTMLGIPDADALSSKVSAIPTAPVASKALINAAEQIRSWISKAQEVVAGLDSEDDVEWAAAGGREGLEEVENAISRFEHLINAYVNAIDELQNRPDIADASTDDLRRAVTQMEAIADEWARIKRTLQSVRNQVEIAMEWEELWNSVLGDIQTEMDELSRLVFEMEERRHKSLAVAANGDNVDIGDLETIVEDNPLSAARLQPPNRLSLALPLAPNAPGNTAMSQDDSSLLALFARMQPLRASLDFLPMRLSVFEQRAKHAFPTACEELDMRHDGLDGSYKKLEKDAESLRKELGEDRWVIVFRGAGRQAQKMHESVERSLMKLREAIDSGMHLTNQPSIAKKIESYEAKKTHYGPAIGRVLSIIDKGVKDRLTVNGEILRLHAEMETRWESLKLNMGDMDAILEDIYAERRSQKLRDSISSMLSNDRSTNGSGMETPGSSPPSSVIMPNMGRDPRTPARKQGVNQLRSPNASSSSLMSSSSSRRDSSLPAPVSRLGKKTPSRLSYYPPSASASTLRPASTMGHRPRWNSSANTLDVEGSHTPHRTPAPVRSTSALTPLSTSKLPTPRSSLTRAGSESPMSESFPRSWSRTGHSRLSFRERLTSPGPYSQSSLFKQTPSRRSNVQPTVSTLNLDTQNVRPSSSLASSRRQSLLPMPRRPDSRGGSSPLPIFSRFTSRKYSDNPPEPKDLKPRWRF
ncbi:hypothetical protein TRIATDRAFT_47200 [Trichoderma atroviride IMI 206040]|uniref:Karyogamy protein n=1 Tax=Hypocrea atroviridis (strain ATCC 20476 / IMI 206040) TaxID=452589 RepID=G9NML4_HYPAI|nr:uncharacterized protein TRIATDRAFT_47200 [Trichoderma atroviride IMI 206040]EHK48144.1 hypothetical protein TRIATDRAFT_47200 [Trichoderma atroviride IMI 206040]